MLKIKRIYDLAAANDGYRVLVDRLWPRGISKEKAHVDLWLREIAPSDELRKWFGHDPKRWAAFASKYRKELRSNRDAVREMKKLSREHRRLTLLYGARDTEHNQAAALRQFLAGARAR